jgi:hypothetical protein
MPNAATQSEQMSDPIDRIHSMSKRLTEVIDCLRADIGRIEEPQFRAIFETAAEVLGGLVTAFGHYEKKANAPGNGNDPKAEIGRRSPVFTQNQSESWKAPQSRHFQDARRGGEARARGAIF